jgi:hypothetical protein
VTRNPVNAKNRYANAVEAIDITTSLYLFPASLARTSHNKHLLQAAVADSDLSILCLDATKSLSLAVCEVIHGRLGKVEAIASVVNGKNVDGLAVVGDTVAGTAL